jgi:hypothetical protein
MTPREKQMGFFPYDDAVKSWRSRRWNIPVSFDWNILAAVESQRGGLIKIRIR